MDSGGAINFPKMEKSFGLQYLLEDQLQRSMELPNFTPTTPTEKEFKPRNDLLEYPNTPLFSSNFVQHQPQQQPQPQMMTQGVLDNNFGADFHLWSECPPLCTEDVWQQPTISQLLALPPPPPSALALPMLETSNATDQNNSFSVDNNEDQMLLLSNYSFNEDDDFFNNNNNDESLSMVVAQCLSKPTTKEVDEELEVGGGYEGADNKSLIISNEMKKPSYNCKVSKIESLQYDDIRKYFDMPISMAAKELNVGLTVLKKRCRELNIRRWPHRKLKSLKALINNVREMGLFQMAEALEEDRKKLHLLPEMELTAETKKIRQACFKANYKKRRAMALLAV